MIVIVERPVVVTISTLPRDVPAFFVIHFGRLRPSVDAARITAKLEDGLLTLSLPCLADALPRKVEVT